MHHNFRIFLVFKFAGAGYSSVEIFACEIFTDIHQVFARYAIFSGDLGILGLFMVLSYWCIFIDPMATDPLCTAATMLILLSASFHTAFTIERKNNFSTLEQCHIWVLRTNRHVYWQQEQRLDNKGTSKNKKKKEEARSYHKQIQTYLMTLSIPDWLPALQQVLAAHCSQWRGHPSEPAQKG